MIMRRKKLILGYVLLLPCLYMIYTIFNTCPTFYLTLDNRYLDMDFQLPLHSNPIPEKLQQAVVQYSNIDDSPKVAGQYDYSFYKVSYKEALKNVSNDKGEVLLALIDGGFMAMALNFIITSLAGQGVENYLLLATDHKVCQALKTAKVHCFVYREDLDAAEASIYHSPAFLRKMNIRTDMILDALDLGYKVLHSDIDIVFYSNPFDSIKCSVGDCDLASLVDTSDNANAGFIYINPTDNGKSVYRQMREMVLSNTTKDDQDQLNTVIKEHKTNISNFKHIMLDEKQFQCGYKFYEEGNRYFGNDPNVCSECVVVHNNWIVSMEAKVYRAKELHQWMVDAKGYYSNPHAKYLTYNNPFNGKFSFEAELEALHNAFLIGRALSRIVILPRFHCDCVQCPLNSLLRLVDFDQDLKGQYREHSFLSHPLVPDSVRQSIYGPLFIQTSMMGQDIADKLTHKEVLDLSVDEKLTQIVSRFKGRSESVLHFFHLYDVLQPLSSEETVSFKEVLSKASKRIGYRQM